MEDEAVPLTRVHRLQLRALGLEHEIAGLGLEGTDWFHLVAESKLEILVRERRQVWVRWMHDRGSSECAEWLWAQLPAMPNAAAGLGEKFTADHDSSTIRARSPEV